MSYRLCVARAVAAMLLLSLCACANGPRSQQSEARGPELVLDALAKAWPPCRGIAEAPNGLTMVYGSGARTRVTPLGAGRSRIEKFDPDGALLITETTLSGAFLEKSVTPGGERYTATRHPDPRGMLPLKRGASQRFQITAESDGRVVSGALSVSVVGEALMIVTGQRCSVRTLVLEYSSEAPTGSVKVLATNAPSLLANVANIPDGEMVEGRLNHWDMPEQIIYHP